MDFVEIGFLKRMVTYYDASALNRCVFDLTTDNTDSTDEFRATIECRYKHIRGIGVIRGLFKR